MADTSDARPNHRRADHLVWSLPHHRPRRRAPRQRHQIFGVVFALAVLIWASPPQLRQRPELWALATAVTMSVLIPTIGNLRVVTAIGTDNWTDDQASALGPLRPGFVSGHDLAERWTWLVIGVAVLLAGWLWFKHAVSNGVGIAAIVLSLIFPRGSSPAQA